MDDLVVAYFFEPPCIK